MVAEGPEDGAEGQAEPEPWPLGSQVPTSAGR